MSDSELHQRVLAAFQTEFKEQMAAIRTLLAAWPQVPPAMLEDAFRMAHSMKGGARVCDLEEVESIAHQMENILAALTKGKASLTPETRIGLETYADAAEDAMSAAFVSETPETGTPETPVSALTGVRDTLRIESSLLDDLVQSSGLVLAEANRQETLGQDLAALSEKMELLRRLLHVEQTEVADLRFHVREADKELQRLRDRQQRGSRSLRVLSGQIQEHVSRVCMVPISSVFEGFPKMMRDLSAETGKPVRFVMTGTELQADRAVLQALKDPIMHALSNALSHGIEPAAERRQKGKSETAEVHLHLEIDGQFLRLTVDDDGRGVDLEGVRKMALQAKLVNATESAQLSPDSLLDLIFHPGLSTATEVTRVSGRGMGLSVVREQAARFQGSARMISQEGRGSTLEIRVPVSVSARRLLLFRAAGQVFALPLSSLRGLLRVDQIHTAEGRSVIFRQGAAVQVTTAAEAAGAEPKITRGEDGKIRLILLQGSRGLALHVEAFLGEFHALVRPLPFPASRSPHFSGSLLMEDGKVVLVLNAQTLADRSRSATLQEEAPAAAPAQPQQATVLVVDDSFTARTLQKSILETAGYRVRTAEDGRAALAFLHANEVALVVSDVQMPHMDGFQLLASLKASPALAHIPVILVTSLSSQEDQERGLALGADAYIVKERFDHQQLLGIVRQLV